MRTTQTDPEGGIASRIREARRGAGLTQHGLAALVGVTRHTVWCWEAGRTRPSRKHRRGIALHCKAPALAPPGREAPAREPGWPPRVLVPREERMRAVLGVLARYAAEHGYPPSMQEMMDETGFSSKSVVGYSLDACEEAGLIVRARGMARTVTLTEAGRAFAETSSATGSLPARSEEIAPSAPPAAPARPAATITRPPTMHQVAEDRACPVERTTNTGNAGAGSGIATRIREARRSAGLIQRELAALVGVSQHTVWSWEAGGMKPTYEHRAAIAFHCGTDVGALEEREEPDQDRLREAVAAFRDAVAHLPERDIESIWLFIRFRRWQRRRAGK